MTYEHLYYLLAFALVLVPCFYFTATQFLSYTYVNQSRCHSFAIESSDHFHGEAKSEVQPASTSLASVATLSQLPVSDIEAFIAAINDQKTSKNIPIAGQFPLSESTAQALRSLRSANNIMEVDAEAIPCPYVTFARDYVGILSHLVNKNVWDDEDLEELSEILQGCMSFVE